MPSKLALHHDETGKVLSGSVDALIKGIEEGQQVRAVLQDPIGPIAYDHFVTLRVISEKKLVNAVLPLRPAANDDGALFDAFGANVAVLDTTGKYNRIDGLGSTGVFTRQYAVKWFLD